MGMEKIPLNNNFGNAEKLIKEIHEREREKKEKKEQEETEKLKKRFNMDNADKLLVETKEREKEQEENNATEQVIKTTETKENINKQEPPKETEQKPSSSNIEEKKSNVPEIKKNSEEAWNKEKEVEGVKQYLAERATEDEGFFAKLISKTEYDKWQDENEKEFKRMSPGQKEAAMKILGGQLGRISRQISEIKDNLDNPNFKNSKEDLKKQLAYLKKHLRAVRARTQLYHRLLGAKSTEQPKKNEKELKINNKEKQQNTKESPKTLFEELMKNYQENKKITADSFIKFISTPGAGEFLAQSMKDPNFQEKLQQPENQKKIKETIDKFQMFLKQNQEQNKEKPVPRALRKAKEFIQNASKEKKKSIWKTTGEIMGWSAFLFFILFTLLELKGIEQLTGLKIEGGKKKK